MWDPSHSILLCFEATPETGIRDYFAARKRHGVQVVSLSSRLQGYNGKICWRHLEFERTPAHLATLDTLRRALSGLPYERNVWEFLKASLGGNKRENRKSIFCSELVAHVLRECGILAETLPSNAYTPEDFSTQADRPINWSHWVHPCREVLLEAKS